MRLVLELSGEHPELARAEALAILDVLGGGTEAERDALAILVDVADDLDAKAIADRAGLLHAVSAHWYTAAATPRAILPPLAQVNLEGARFAVRGTRMLGLHPELPLEDTARSAGAVLAETGVVDLGSPDVEVRIVLGEHAHVGALVKRVDRKPFDARAVRHRPFFSPVSLHPRHVRALVNLARVKPGDLVYDPFSGTGGMLLEAALVGARIVASDVDARMVEGTRITLAHFGLAADATYVAADVGRMREVAPRVDAIVTDPPFGRAASLQREPIEDLYERFFAGAADVLAPGGRVAATYPSEALARVGERHLDLELLHPWRVHKSLTRWFAVHRKA
ncbi:MAG TPA: TRM11 family methyltransferase [Candidatus Thermoplasmatota archaeon]|nr:TRM11 family methyltransferase [Candidatus Thermoplasmatota archaeon]